MADAGFEITFGTWFNKEKSPGKFAKAPAWYAGFSYTDFEYGKAYPASEGFVTENALQLSIICSKSTMALAIDVDYPENLPSSRTGELVSAQDAISMHNDHFHILVDMRGVSEAEWPQQGRTLWGDIKSSGFIPVPGSTHYREGETYTAAPDWQSRIIKATPELIAALKSDRHRYADNRLNEARIKNPRQAGVHDTEGRYVYASGYVDGSWAQLPDGFLEHDDELKDLVRDMGTRGHPYDAVLAEWRRLAGSLDPGHPWTDKDFERHWRNIPRMFAEIKEAADLEEIGWQAFGIDTDAVAQKAQAARDYVLHQQENFVPYTDEASSSAVIPSSGPSLSNAVIKYLTRLNQAAWIGAFPFEPDGLTDAEDAELLLQRIYPIARYCIMQDTWIGRQLDRWEIVPIDYAEGLVNIPPALGLMPKGASEALLKTQDIDPQGEQGRAMIKQWDKYKKFGNANDAGKIARKLKAALKAPISHNLSEDLLDMDNDPEEFWAGGICWDLRNCTTQLLPKNDISNAVHLHAAGCLPDLDCPTDLWDSLLRAIWPDSSVRDWALLVLSAGLTGYPTKVVPVLQGGTHRGKSTIVDAIADVLGTYFRPINPKVLDATASTHDTVLMELKGARFVFLDEGVSRNKMSTARLKRLAGGSAITANRMRKDPLTFRPTHTLAIALNPEESIAFDDPAIESRIRFLPCEGDPAEVIAVAKQLSYFRSPAWQAERPGVLAKLMQTAALMLSDPDSLAKDRAPLAAQMAEQEAKEADDDVLRWFMEATAADPKGYPSNDLFISFREWTRELKGDRSYIPSLVKWGIRMNELVPEDAEHPLRTSQCRLRRRKPLPPGYTGGPAPTSPTVAQFMTDRHSASPRPAQPYTDGQPYTNPTRHETPGQRGCSVEYVGYVGYNDVSPLTQAHTHTQSGIQDPPTHPASLHSPSDAAPAPAWPPAQEIPEGSARTETQIPPQGQKLPVQESGNPPSAPKKPSRARMTPEERQARQEAKRAETARLKAETLSAALLELGGPIVQLPAIVLRDQTIIPVPARQASDFLVPFMDELSVDVEHTGYAIGHENYALRLVQLGGEAAAVVLDPSDPESAQVISLALQSARKLHAHSALADLIPLEHAGLCDASAWDKMDDTVIKAKLTDPKLTDSDESGLKPLGKNLLGPDYALSWKCDELKGEICEQQGWLTETVTSTPLDKSGWAMMPFNEAFIRYAASDVMDCSAVSRALDTMNPIAPELLKREQQFMAAFRPIALSGTPLDEPHVRELIQHHERERENSRLRVQEATGGEITNPKSTTEVPRALIALGYDLPRTKPTRSKPEGGLSAAKGVLEPLAGNILEARELHQAGEMTIQELTDVEQRFSTLAADILEYRKHDTALGLLLNPWKDLCERGDGRIRSSIMTIEARTGRTSSRGFNMQQVNRRGGMRRCITTENENTRGISADFNSVEVRVGAAMSGDEMMQYLIAQGDLYPERKKEFDFHWRTAITCYGQNATKENRYNSKRINFAKMFGSGKQSCADLVGVPVHEVSMAFDAFSAIAPQYEAWDGQMREFVKRGGRSVEAYSGRPLFMDPAAEWGAGNTVIQGTARELAVDATLKWRQTKFGYATLLIVHDELCAWNIPAEDAEEATQTLVACMETELFGVKIRAEANPVWNAWPDAS